MHLLLVAVRLLLVVILKKITPEAFHLHLCEDLPLLPGQLLFVEPRGVQLLELLPQKDHTNRDSTRSNS